MMSMCAFGCEETGDLNRKATSVYRIVAIAHPQDQDATAFIDIPQRLQRVWVLLCLFPNEEVPFVMLGYFRLDDGMSAHR